LAFVIPALAIGFAWSIWRGRVRPRAWIVVVGLQAVLLGTGLFAMNTGEREEERVEAIVPDAALDRHEEYAEQFVWATGGTLVLAGLVLVLGQRRISRALMAATVTGSMIVALAAIRVGHAGGQLVYVHNAGSAYARQPVVATDGRLSRESAEPARIRRED
jgi:hypothetical protein